VAGFKRCRRAAVGQTLLRKTDIAVVFASVILMSAKERQGVETPLILGASVGEGASLVKKKQQMISPTP
jgi:hypothetical protein